MGLLRFSNTTSEYRDSENTVIYTVDHQRKKIIYKLKKNHDIERPYDRIILNGFEKLPSGFYINGYGITKPTGFILHKELRQEIGDKYNLIISESGTSYIKVGKKKNTAIFTYADFKRLHDRLRGRNEYKVSNQVTQLNTF